MESQARRKVARLNLFNDGSERCDIPESLPYDSADLNSAQNQEGEDSDEIRRIVSPVNKNFKKHINS